MPHHTDAVIYGKRVLKKCWRYFSGASIFSIKVLKIGQSDEQTESILCQNESVTHWRPWKSLKTIWSFFTSDTLYSDRTWTTRWACRSTLPSSSLRAWLTSVSNLQNINSTGIEKSIRTGKNNVSPMTEPLRYSCHSKINLSCLNYYMIKTWVNRKTPIMS